MSNLMNFFSGGSASAAVPLRALVPFPHDTPPKVEQNGQVFLRSGRSEVIDYDPSLQSWVNDNVMFINTQSLPSSQSSNFTRGTAVDTDGAGKWMVAGFANHSGGQANTLPRVYYSDNDASSWQPLTIPALNPGYMINSIKSGGNGVWIITAAGNADTGFASFMFRTANNGASWTDIASTAMLSNSSAFRAIETDRNGVWLICFGFNRTTIRRSADNGVTWTSVNFPQGNCYVLKSGNGQWIAGCNDPLTANNPHTTIVVSLDNGASWQTPITTVTLADFAYVQGGWVGTVSTGIMHNLAGDFSVWNVVDIRYDDSFSDAAQTSVVWSLSSGLDGTLWLRTSSTTHRSIDRGVSWQRVLPSLGPVMSAPNKRAVAVMTTTTADLFYGIVTGRPAAGCAYINDGRPASGGDTSQRYVMYMRIK
jgi:hypothetical protein